MKNSENLIHSFNHTENTEGNFKGLTKRECFALHIMTGLCVQAIAGNHNTLENQKRELVPHAIGLADELLKQLEA